MIPGLRTTNDGHVVDFPNFLNPGMNTFKKSTTLRSCWAHLAQILAMGVLFQLCGGVGASVL